MCNSRLANQSLQLTAYRARLCSALLSGLMVSPTSITPPRMLHSPLRGS